MNRLAVRVAIALAASISMDCPAAVTPEGEATQVRSALPGEIYRGAIEIRNPGSGIVQVKLYQSDYAFFADGTNNFAAPGTLARSNAAWLRLNQEQITLGPRSVLSVDYEVRVPDQSLAGTYWSLVMVQELPAAESAGAPRGGVKLGQNLRHAIQIVTEIGDSGRGELAFRNPKLLREGGRREFDVDVENVGERWLRTEMWIELHDAQGRFAGRYAARRCRTFPGTSVRNRIELSTAPAGNYLGLLVADGGRNDLFGMQIELDLR